MRDRDDGVIRSQIGILNATLLHGREHHGSVGKELLPVALDKGDCGRAEAHNQVERAFGMRARRYSTNGASGFSSLERAAQERMLCDFQRPW